jgi:hypothetical protein
MLSVGFWSQALTTSWVRLAPTRTSGATARRLASRGAKNSKKQAVMAVARKLCVLLHSLWVSAEVYEPECSKGRSSKFARYGVLRSSPYTLSANF